MADIVERAKALAYRAHAGQVDKAGRPYIEHVARVAAAVRTDGLCSNDDCVLGIVANGCGDQSCCPSDPLPCPTCDLAESVAWLHDTLEDGGADCIDEVKQLPGNVRYAVSLLTRCDDVPCGTYYAEIRTNPLALRVKLADIADDEARLALLDPETADRLRRKYARARTALGVG